MRRKRRKKTKKLGSLSLISIMAITMLNVLGISYAQWNEGLNITSLVSTGKINPYYKRLKSWECKYPHENVDVRIVGGDTIRIDGTVEPGYEGVFMYISKNSGTIPVGSEGEFIFPDDSPVAIIKPDGMLGPKNRGKIKGAIVIKPICDDINKTFEINEEIEFEQFN